MNGGSDLYKPYHFLKENSKSIFLNEQLSGAKYKLL